jgi:hypothetical protein
LMAVFGASTVPSASVPWVAMADGSFVHGRSRIEPIPGPNGGWVLEITRWGERDILRSTHATLSGAKAWAAHYERTSVRRANRVRHGVIAVACAAAWLWLTFLLGPHGTAGRAVVFGTAVILFFLALHEMVEVLDSVVPDDASDRTSPVAVPADRLLETAILRLSEGARAEGTHHERAITVIDPWDDDPPR